MARYSIYYLWQFVKGVAKKMHSKTKKIVIASLMTALICVATLIIKIPSPLKGYLNLGDCVVLLAGWTISPGYAFWAAGLGSALADLLSGYAAYAPATFLIKGAMALISSVFLKLPGKRVGQLSRQIVGGLVAESAMVMGYFVFEGLLYGFSPSVVNIPVNAVQGIAGLIIGVTLARFLRKANISAE